MKKIKVLLTALFIANIALAQTTFIPGDIVIVGLNANTGGGTDQISFVSFKDITTGTVFDITDNGYERVNAGQFGDNEGAFRITRTGGTITAGTVFTLQFSANLGITPDNNWDFTSQGVGGGFNMNTNGDQLFIFQGGTWNNPAGAHDATYTGGVMIFAFNTKTTWTADGSTQQSNKFPFYECFHVSPTTASDWSKYNGSLTAADQRTWLSRINNSSNWQTYSSSANYNSNGNNYIGGFTLNIISGGFTEGNWIGNVSTNWFDCANWQSLLVPNKNSNVLIGTLAQRDAVVNFTAQYSDFYNDTANCHNLQINNRKVAIENTRNSLINVYGNLTIGANGELDMSDGNNSTLDGQLFLHGDFYNSRNSETFFSEGGSLVHFVGNANQIINSEATIEQFYDIIIDKPSGIISLQKNIEIDKDGEMEGGILKMIKGKIDGNGNKLIISNNSINAITDYSALCYLYNGIFDRQVTPSSLYDYPVGTSQFYELAKLNLASTINIEGANDYISSQFISPNSGTTPTGIVEDNIEYTDLLDAGYWEIISSGALLAGTFDLELFEKGYTNGGASNYIIVKRENTSSNWALEGQHDYFNENTGTVNVKRNDFASFSHFAIAKSGVLPFANINENDFSACSGIDTIITLNGTPNATVTLNINGTNQDYTLDNNGNLAFNTGSISNQTIIILTNITSSTGVNLALSDTIQITIIPTDDATFSYNNTVCITGDNPIPTITGLAGGIFSVNNGSINTTTGEFDLATANPNTTYTITYQTNGDCPNSSSIEIFVTNAPNSAFSYSGPYCINSGVISVTLGSGASGGIFSSTNGLSINQTTGDIDLNTSTAGTYTVTNTIEASGGCDASISNAEIIINPLPTITVDNQVICIGESVVFTANGALTYSWSDGIENGVSFTPTTAGSFNYSVEGTDANGCKNSASASLLVNELDNANFNYAKQLFCKNEPNANVILAGTSSGIFTTTNGLQIDTDNGTIVIGASNSGNYTITFSTNGACPNSATYAIEIADLPTVNAGTDQIVCTEGIDLVGISDNTIRTNWSVNNISVSNQLSFSTSISANSHFVLEVENDKGCVNSDTVFIKIEKVVAQFEVSAIEGIAPMLVLFNNSSLNADKYVWNFADGTANEQNTNPEHLFQNQGEYQVILTASNASNTCTDTASVKITVRSNSFLTMPNVFTPNGDMINDLLIPENSQISEFNMVIYNRWGAKMFETNDIKNGWDGDKASAGVYYYQLNAKGYDGAVFNENGWVNLLK